MASGAFRVTRSFRISLRSAHRYASTSANIPAPQPPSIAPKPAIDIRHIRNNPDLHARNCLNRNYGSHVDSPARIVQLFDEWKKVQERARGMREESNNLRSKLAQHTKGAEVGDEAFRLIGPSTKERLVDRARQLKEQLRSLEQEEVELESGISKLAIALPNLTSAETPIGVEPRVLEYINQPAPSPVVDVPTEPSRSHVKIGEDLDLLEFAAASTTSGWGWYFLKNEAALLEQALVQYALSVAMKHGFTIVSPPSMVYSHISSACGFQPRDQGGEQQTYTIRQDSSDAKRGKPELSLTGTAEIPFAGMRANQIIEEADLPLRVVGSSRCYRAEAGSRGVDTKGLYRVHEFTKVEMFAWTKPDFVSATETFQTMVSIQRQILQALGLHCRILEQPSCDLGASATRKQDIEAMFPSRRETRDEGWGEVTSASICTDYQSRRLATRLRTSLSGGGGGKLAFPYTVNGTAVAVPRVLAAILETHWDEKKRSVRIPEVLWPWTHGVRVIQRER